MVELKKSKENRTNSCREEKERNMTQSNKRKKTRFSMKLRCSNY